MCYAPTDVTEHTDEDGDIDQSRRVKQAPGVVDSVEPDANVHIKTPTLGLDLRPRDTV